MFVACFSQLQRCNCQIQRYNCKASSHPPCSGYRKCHRSQILETEMEPVISAVKKFQTIMEVYQAQLQVLEENVNQHNAFMVAQCALLVKSVDNFEKEIETVSVKCTEQCSECISLITRVAELEQKIDMLMKKFSDVFAAFIFGQMNLLYSDSENSGSFVMSNASVNGVPEEGPMSSNVDMPRKCTEQCSQCVSLMTRVDED